MGPAINVDVEDMEDENERLDADEILDISVRLLRALDFVHKAGHVHGGKAKFSPYLDLRANRADSKMCQRSKPKKSGSYLKLFLRLVRRGTI